MNPSAAPGRGEACHLQGSMREIAMSPCERLCEASVLILPAGRRSACCYFAPGIIDSANLADCRSWSLKVVPPSRRWRWCC